MQTKSYIFILLAVLISYVMAAPAGPVERRSGSGSGSGSGFTGDGTYYTVGLGSCGQTNSDSQLVAALNAPQMGNNKYCGKSATVKGPKGTVTVKIVDTCPGCSSGDLDLSPAAFNQIGDQSAGRISISWSWN
ncbi:RlpA-like double-psi beta-barrel-protein domain-containing protein-containing protein [Umbelopsis sp. PMI_123]|nr:RlpA-like double-psi beta-barrel-protein domain-containing protein-containing protein [Umbelopsis sp. PMI_123]